MRTQIERLFRNLDGNEKLRLKAFDAMQREFAVITGCKVEPGRFWISDDGFGSRIRSRTGLKDIESDYWEASLSLSFNEDRFWADVDLFLFKDGKVLCDCGFASDHNT